MKYKIYGDRVKLIDSCFVRKDRFELEMNVIRYNHPTCRLWKRSIGSIRREWAAHVLAYNIGIKRKSTKDVDLDFTQKWYVKLAYFVVGTIALLVIK